MLLDANFLMLPAQMGVDIFEELQALIPAKFELATSRMAVFELMRIAAKAGKHSPCAKIALRMVEKRVSVLESTENVDDWLLKEGIGGAVVCTNDKELIKRLREKRVKVVRVMGRSRLGFAD